MFKLRKIFLLLINKQIKGINVGTRCLTIILDENDNKIAAMYRNYDGYLDVHGKALATFLSDIVLVDGIPCNESPKRIKYANGMECLAAQIVAHFKEKPGNIYLCNPDDNCDNGADYIYIVSSKEKNTIPIIEIRVSNKTLIKGNPKKILKYIKGH